MSDFKQFYFKNAKKAIDTLPAFISKDHREYNVTDLEHNREVYLTLDRKEKNRLEATINIPTINFAYTMFFTNLLDFRKNMKMELAK